jgi:hypothetical protein
VSASNEPLPLEVRGDLQAAVSRSLPALADLLLDVARRQQAQRAVARMLLAHCRAYAARHGIPLPPK